MAQVVRLTRRVALACVAVGLAAAGMMAPVVNADAVAYLVNVTVRPGYDFPNAEAALAYGHDICGRLRSGTPYATLVNEVRSDFATGDDYQGSYLIAQSVNELCPALIWNLRNSAANDRPVQP